MGGKGKYRERDRRKVEEGPSKIQKEVKKRELKMERDGTKRETAIEIASIQSVPRFDPTLCNTAIFQKLIRCVSFRLPCVDIIIQAVFWGQWQSKRI